MEKLQNNPRFINEYRDFQKRILNVDNENLRNDLTRLLIELKNHVSEIDLHHESMLMAGRMPGDITESRTAIQKCRKAIQDRLTAYESSKQTN